MFGKQGDFETGIGLVKQFCAGIGMDPAQVMSKGQNGVVVFSLTKSLPAGKLMPVNIFLVPDNGEQNPARIIVSSPIAPLENISAKSREDFFRMLLQENAKVDTACICILQDNFVTAKADRILKGLDDHELNDMAMIMVNLAGRLHIDLCPRFSVKTIIEDISSQSGQQKGAAAKQAAPGVAASSSATEMLGEIQRFSIKVIEKGESLIQAGNHGQGYRVYYDATFKISALLRSKGKGVAAFDQLRNAASMAMSESQVTDDNAKKCAILRHVLDEILQMKA